MTKENPFRKRIVLIVLALLSVLCITGGLVWRLFFFADSVPAEALAGARAETARVTWTLTLSYWTLDVPKGTTLKVFSVQLLDGTVERRAIVVHDKVQVYLGPLRQQFPYAPIRSVMFTTGADRFILGRVDDSIGGNPEFFSIDRITGVRRFDDIGEGKAVFINNGTIPFTSIPANRDNVLFIPIYGAESDSDLWNLIVEISVDTDRSVGTTSAFRRRYDPPLDISQSFISVKLQDGQ